MTAKQVLIVLAQSAVTWHDAKKVFPDSETTVLIYCPLANDPIWLGFHDGNQWHMAEGEPLPDEHVDAWADLPNPPEL